MVAFSGETSLACSRRRQGGPRAVATLGTKSRSVALRPIAGAEDAIGRREAVYLVDGTTGETTGHAIAIDGGKVYGCTPGTSPFSVSTTGPPTSRRAASGDKPAAATSSPGSGSL